MPTHEITRHSKYSARQMYDMAVDVSAYSEFLPLVRESSVFDEVDEGAGIRRFKGRLLVRKKNLNISETVISEVETNENALTIVSKASGGPLKSLVNTWKFTALADGSSQSKLVLNYQVSNFALRMIIKASQAIVMEKLVEAFERRADQLYS